MVSSLWRSRWWDLPYRFRAVGWRVPLAGLRAGLQAQLADPHTVVPWTPIGVIAAVCVAITLVASLVPTAVALRTPPGRLAAERE